MSEARNSIGGGGGAGGTVLPDFQDSDFFLDINDVAIGEKIGEGQFSTVYIGSYFGDTVAVKKQTRVGTDLEKYLLRELAVLKFIEHENLLEYIGAWNEVNAGDTQSAVYIVTEYAQGGDLMQLLMSDHELSWKFRVNIAWGAARALKHLHTNNLVHRDIKSSNFLLDNNWQCKLSDFGMTREITSRMTICGTDEYMAPEMLFDEDYGPSVDIFSLGMVLLELMARKRVGEDFAHRRPANKFELDVEEAKANLQKDAPQSLILLAFQCLEYEAPDRPEADVVSDWLEELHTDTPEDGTPLPPLPPLPVIPTIAPRQMSQAERESAMARGGPMSPRPNRPQRPSRRRTVSRPSSADAGFAGTGSSAHSVGGGGGAGAPTTPMNGTSNRTPPTSPMNPNSALAGTVQLSNNERGFDLQQQSRERSNAGSGSNQEPKLGGTAAGAGSGDPSPRESHESERLTEVASNTAPQSTSEKPNLPDVPQAQMVDHEGHGRRSVPNMSVSSVRGLSLGNMASKAGYLFKRNRHGFRNWKRRWFMLVGTRLYWYRVPTATDPRGFIEVSKCIIQPTKQNRWQVLDPLDRAKVNDTRLYNRELAAESSDAMQEWIFAIQQAIDNAARREEQDPDSPHGMHMRQEPYSAGARLIASAASMPTAPSATATAIAKASPAAGAAGTGSTSVTPVSSHATGGVGAGVAPTHVPRMDSMTPAGQGQRGAPVTTSQTDMTAVQVNISPAHHGLALSSSTSGADSVQDWLHTLDLDYLFAQFERKGYTSLRSIEEAGLTDRDLDFLEVSVPLHRRVLLMAARGSFAYDVMMEIPSWQDFGSVIVYKVVSRYRFQRSCVYRRYSDFSRLNSNLRKALKADIDRQQIVGDVISDPMESHQACGTSDAAELTHLSPEARLRRLPAVPGKGLRVIQDQRDPVFLETRRIGLQTYIAACLSVLAGTPHVQLVLAFLELVPVPR